MILPKQLEELKDRAQWVNYYFKDAPKADDPNHKGKVPCTIDTAADGSRSARNASTTQPADWTNYETAQENVTRGHADGCGLVFTGGLMGVDLDNVIINGQLIPEAEEIVKAANTYTEYSPSGTGLHLLMYGEMPTNPNGGQDHRTAHTTASGHTWEAEMYDQGRFFTVTGKPYGTPQAIAHNPEGINRIYCGYIQKPQKAQEKKPERKTNITTLEDAELLEKARNAQNGATFTALYDHGDTGAYLGDESRADLALCNILAYWTGCDAARIDTLFRSSALMREKWNERRGQDTYGQMTINKAITDCTNIYEPPQEAYNSAPGEYWPQTWEEYDAMQAPGTPQDAATTQADTKTCFLSFEEREALKGQIDAIQSANKPLYIVETTEDAEALQGCGAEVISIENNEVLQIVCDAEKLPRVIFSVDLKNKAMINGLVKQLDRQHVAYIYQDICGNYPTISAYIEAIGTEAPNIIKDESGFYALGAEAMRAQFGSGKALAEFTASLEDTNAHRHISSGFKNLDTLIGGGFADGLYVLISTTGAGKTSFCLQVADYVITHGTPVLYFSLEMAKDELLAKNITRIMRTKNKHFDISAGELLDLANVKQKRFIAPEIMRELDGVIYNYGTKAAQNLYIVTGPANGEPRTLNTDDIASITRDFIRTTHTKPFVIVDYLQILSKTENQIKERITLTEKAGNDAFFLKRLSRKEDAGVPILAISSTARHKNETDLGVDAAKNSGDIEYAANAIMILQPDGYSKLKALPPKEQAAELAHIKRIMRDAERSGGAYTVELKVEKERFNPKSITKINFTPRYGLWNDAKIGGEELDWNDSVRKI